MKKIYVKFKNITLGELTFNNGCFVYQVNSNDICNANNCGYPIGLYNTDKNFISKTLPFSLEDLIPNENTNLYKLANITALDSEFEKLFKIAQLNLDNSGLYVSIN